MLLSLRLPGQEELGQFLRDGLLALSSDYKSLTAAVVVFVWRDSQVPAPYVGVATTLPSSPPPSPCLSLSPISLPSFEASLSSGTVSRLLFFFFSHSKHAAKLLRHMQYLRTHAVFNDMKPHRQQHLITELQRKTLLLTADPFQSSNANDKNNNKPVLEEDHESDNTKHFAEFTDKAVEQKERLADNNIRATATTHTCLQSIQSHFFLPTFTQLSRAFAIFVQVVKTTHFVNNISSITAALPDAEWWETRKERLRDTLRLQLQQIQEAAVTEAKASTLPVFLEQRSILHEMSLHGFSWSLKDEMESCNTKKRKKEVRELLFCFFLCH